MGGACPNLESPSTGLPMLVAGAAAEAPERPARAAEAVSRARHHPCANFRTCPLYYQKDEILLIFFAAAAASASLFYEFGCGASASLGRPNSVFRVAFERVRARLPMHNARCTSEWEPVPFFVVVVADRAARDPPTREALRELGPLYAIPPMCKFSHLSALLPKRREVLSPSPRGGARRASVSWMRTLLLLVPTA